MNPNTPIFDQTDDIKLAGDVEYRFGIYEHFKGALFVDAGNVWLLKKRGAASRREIQVQEALKRDYPRDKIRPPV